MAKTPKTAPAADKTDFLDPMQMRLRVVAPLGARRRAGISFGAEPTDLTMADLGEDMEAAQETLKILMADPQLSVSPVIEAGTVRFEPGAGGGDKQD